MSHSKFHLSYNNFDKQSEKFVEQHGTARVVLFVHSNYAEILFLPLLLLPQNTRQYIYWNVHVVNYSASCN